MLPTILEYKEKYGEYPKYLSLSLAYLIYFYKNDTPDDNAEVISVMKNNSIADILANTSLWQADISDITDIVTVYYEKIAELGAKETMKWILS